MTAHPGTLPGLLVGAINFGSLRFSLSRHMEFLSIHERRNPSLPPVYDDPVVPKNASEISVSFIHFYD